MAVGSSARNAAVLFFIGLVLLAPGASAKKRTCLYDSKGPVKVLTSDNFAETISNEGVWLVQYAYNDTNSHVFKDEYLNMARKLAGIVNVGVVCCQDDLPLCSAAKIEAIPAFHVFPWRNGPHPDDPSNLVKIPVVHDLEKYGISAKVVTDLATGMVPSDYISKLSSTDGSDWQAQLSAEPSVPSVVIITERADPTSLAKASSLRFRTRARFFSAREEDAPIATHLGVDEAPAVVVLMPDGTRLAYDGPTKAVPLAEFLDEHLPNSAVFEPAVDREFNERHAAALEAAKAKQIADAEAKAAKKAEEDARLTEEQRKRKEAAEKAERERVLISSITLRQVPDAVYGTRAMVLLGVRHGSKELCAEQWRQWEVQAVPLSYHIRLLQISAAEGDRDAEGVAALAKKLGAPLEGGCIDTLLFPAGLEEKEEMDPDVFSGELSTEALKAFVISGMPDFVLPLSEQSATLFYTTDLHIPKLILISNKTETPEVWKVLAQNFHPEIKFAIVQADTTVAQHLFPRQIPTIKLLIVPPGGKKPPPGPNEPPFNVLDYSGKMKLEPLFSFVTDVLRKASGAADGGEEGKAGAGGAAGKAAAAVKPGPPVEVPQASDAEEWALECLDKAALCAVGFLAPSKGDRLLDKHLAVLQAAHAGLTEKPVSFVWVDGARNGHLLRACDLPEDSLPAFAVLAPRKMRAAPLRARFAADTIAEHVAGVLDGSVKTIPTGPLPAFAAAAAAGEGSGAEAAAETEAAMEEELPLEEVMGGEETSLGGAGGGRKKGGKGGRQGDGDL